jgi:hypothetical protein
MLELPRDEIKNAYFTSATLVKRPIVGGLANHHEIVFEGYG